MENCIACWVGKNSPSLIGSNRTCFIEGMAYVMLIGEARASRIEICDTCAALLGKAIAQMGKAIEGVGIPTNLQKYKDEALEAFSPKKENLS